MSKQEKEENNFFWKQVYEISHKILEKSKKLK